MLKSILYLLLCLLLISCAKQHAYKSEKEEQIATSKLSKEFQDQVLENFDSFIFLIGGRDDQVAVLSYSDFTSEEKASLVLRQSLKEKFDYSLGDYRSNGEQINLIEERSFQTIEDFKLYFFKYHELKRIFLIDIGQDVYNLKLYELDLE